MNALSGKLVVVIGADGFIGSHVAQELLSRGARLRVVSRRPERSVRIKPLGGLGQVQLLRGDVTRPESIAPLLAGAHAVVNLAGAFAGDLQALHVTGPAALAAAAKTAGAEAFVHISALGVDAESPVAYSRTKAAGEAAVKAAFPGATILRPSVVFGPEDHFLNRFGALAALPVLPVFGPEARFQPVFVDDVAAAVAVAVADPRAHGGKTYELAGPEVVTMLDLNRMVADAAQRHPLLVAMPDALSGLFAALTGWLPGAPITSDQWKLLKAGNVASGELPGLKALGIAARPMGLYLDRWMVRFRKHGRFGAVSAV